MEGTNNNSIYSHDRPCELFHLWLHSSGWGTDEQAVISILAHRDASQRKQIALEYEHKYSESLIQRLQSELSGDFEVLKRAFFFFVSSFSSPADRTANAACVCREQCTTGCLAPPRGRL